MYALLHWYHREPRVVLKNTLAWDPAIDVVLNRVPARFISPNPAAGEDLESQIASLATGLDDNDAFVIFPEGGNFTAARRDRAIAKLRYERPDVAVIDLMLPGTDGWRITETLRAEGIETPIVIVSARGSEHDKVHALGIGGDDYLSKPFGMRELVARVEAVLRRAGMKAAAGSEVIVAEGLVIDPDLHAAILEGSDVGLTPTEFRLLYVLAGERGRALSRDQLQQRVWGIPHRHRDRTVDVCVRKLRDKIDPRAIGHTYIQTHPGVGYRFEAMARGPA
jgi:DNA-binding response OmpR family regulator